MEISLPYDVKRILHVDANLQGLPIEWDLSLRSVGINVEEAIKNPDQLKQLFEFSDKLNNDQALFSFPEDRTVSLEDLVSKRRSHEDFCGYEADRRRRSCGGL